MMPIDCNNLERVPLRTYGGATGEKIAVLYDGIVYMLKRQQRLYDRNLKNVKISYGNDVISEYIGSHVYEILDIPVHSTMLGTYKDRLCILCRDIAYPGVITEFRQLRNSIIDEVLNQDSSGMSTNIDDILQVINLADYINKEKTLSRFWLMFVVDSVIGNSDRNNGNWGYLLDGNAFKLAPVYDCGGCLNNKKSDQQLEACLDNKGIESMAINYVFNYKVNGKQINPFHYMRDNMNPYLQRAVDYVSTLDISKVEDMVYEMLPIISEARAEYYVRIMSRRLEEIRKYKSGYGSMLYSLKKISNQER